MKPKIYEVKLKKSRIKEVEELKKSKIEEVRE
jgi:hypothetical protein